MCRMLQMQLSKHTISHSVVAVGFQLSQKTAHFGAGPWSVHEEGGEAITRRKATQKKPGFV